MKSGKPDEHWQATCEQRKANSFLKNPPVKKGGDLLTLSRNQLRIMTG
jgi:hypothetical protein